MALLCSAKVAIQNPLFVCHTLTLPSFAPVASKDASLEKSQHETPSKAEVRNPEEIGPA